MFEAPSIENLRRRLQQINHVWTTDNYQALVDFFVRILPPGLNSERCSVFVVDPQSGRIESTIGTGLERQTLVVPRRGSVVGRVIESAEACVENGLDHREGFHQETARQTGFTIRNLVCCPIHSLTDARVLGAVEVMNKQDGQDYHDGDLALLQEASGYLAMAMENIQVGQEILALSEQIGREYADLRDLVGSEFIAASPGMRAVVEQVRVVAPLPINVYVGGENGTGKEQVARLLHQLGPRRDKPFVAINCAAIPEALVESEFFGYEKGAFTGAAGNRPGRFEEASGGTLFLDEVGDMPAAMQAKLLRVLQEGEGSRLGSNRLHHYDLRVVSASNKVLRDEVTAGRFREDLFYRLFSVEVHLPPLRERAGDIEALALSFANRTVRRFDKMVAGFAPEVLAAFGRYSWPGNVRQLSREVERLVALTPNGERMELEYCSPELRGEAVELPAVAVSGDLDLHGQVEQLERHLIAMALEQTSGNKAAASRLLGITRPGLHKKLARYGI